QPSRSANSAAYEDNCRARRKETTFVGAATRARRMIVVGLHRTLGPHISIRHDNSGTGLLALDLASVIGSCAMRSRPMSANGMLSFSTERPPPDKPEKVAEARLVVFSAACGAKFELQQPASV